MSFIERSACNGSFPPSLAGKLYFNRDDLLTAMIRDRTSIRYLVAPDGFGKSMLACSYADLVNGMLATIWVDCGNPCFFRDLDAFALLPDLLRATEPGWLVVFDDACGINRKRSEEFLSVCLGLVEDGREVLVCTTPGSDPFRAASGPIERIEAEQLLYGQNELELVARQGVPVAEDALSRGPLHRIGGLLSASREANERFVAAHLADMPSDWHRALSFAMLAVESGPLADLESVLGREVTLDDVDPGHLRPFARCDPSAHTFDAAGLPFADVLRAGSVHLPRIAQACGFDGVDDYVCALSNAMLARQLVERPAQILNACCTPSARAHWLEDNQSRLVEQGAIAAAEQVFDNLQGTRRRQMGPLQVGSCIRQALLSPGQASLQALLKAASRADYTLPERIEAALFCLALAPPGDAAGLDATFGLTEARRERELSSLGEDDARLLGFFGVLADSSLTAAKLIKALPAEPSTLLALTAGLCWARDAHMRPAELRKLADRAAAMLAEQVERDGATLSAHLLQQALATLPDAADSVRVDAQTEFACTSFGNVVDRQRRAYAKGKVARLGVATALAATQMHLADVAKREVAPPLLEVNLLGCFDVRIGEHPVAPAGFTRRKVRTLLAVLVMEAGRDLSCESLCRRLWPDSDHSRAVHSLYNCVSILRKGLTLADGTCPYIHRPHNVIRLEKSLVRSDVSQLRSICNQLKVQDPGPNGYLALGERLMELYQGELLPSERDEPLIIAERNELRTITGNALLDASRKLLGVGNHLAALQLAQAAHFCDPAREDCYEQLMMVQAQSGQRPAAIGTWMEYRSYLYDELGLDPSPRIAQLYESIIAQ